jgi:hypothetical protein
MSQPSHLLVAMVTVFFTWLCGTWLFVIVICPNFQRAISCSNLDEMLRYFVCRLLYIYTRCMQIYRAWKYLIVILSFEELKDFERQYLLKYQTEWHENLQTCLKLHVLGACKIWGHRSQPFMTCCDFEFWGTQALQMVIPPEILNRMTCNFAITFKHTYSRCMQALRPQILAVHD